MRPRPRTKKYMRPRKAGPVEGSSWGKAHQLVVQCQMVWVGVWKEGKGKCNYNLKTEKKRLLTSRTNNSVLMMSKDYISTPQRML